MRQKSGYSKDTEYIVRKIDDFVEGNNKEGEERSHVSTEGMLKPADILISVKPFNSGRILARIANIVFSPTLKAMKKSLLPYFNQNDQSMNHLTSTMDVVSNKIQQQPDLVTIFDQKIYEIAKLNDRLKSELMAEINKDNSPISGSGKSYKVETKIINEKAHMSLKKLNLGSGSFFKEGYINVDHRAIEGVDVIADIGDLPYAQGSLDEIFLSHVAEHFTERKFTELLKYWYSLLAKNGKVVIIVPDIDAMIRRYVDKDITWSNLRQVILGGQDYNSDYHFNAFSTDYIEEVVKSSLPNASYKLVDSARRNGESLELEIEIRKK